MLNKTLPEFQEFLRFHKLVPEKNNGTIVTMPPPLRIKSQFLPLHLLPFPL